MLFVRAAPPQTYMVPEGAGNGSVLAYRAEAEGFPLRWRPEAVLLHGSFVDSTLFEWGGRWWMFTSPSEPGLGMERLHIYHAETPLGPWQPHARNPVMVAPDRRGARQAGGLLKLDGQLFRFGQDGSVAYGHSVRRAGGWGRAVTFYTLPQPV